MTAAVLGRLKAAIANRYRVERELGAGGMATVYLAHDLKHEREVAIKVLHPDLGAALGGERFLAEIKTTAKLQHPHILPLLDSGEADGLLYYVMPYVRGETLRTRLERERQLPIPDAVRIAREVAGALEHAHKQGIIHRDIKPENILLQDGSALVADFGIALALQSAGGTRMTQAGMSIGTPQYMSPEQAMGERTVDTRSDLYALGVITYEMLAGEPPFSGASAQAIVAKVLSERPVPLRTLRDTIPPDLGDAVVMALAKLPADRHATVREFAEALTSTGGRHGEPPVAPPAAFVTARDRASAPQRSRPSRLLLGLAIGGAMASALWWVLRPAIRTDDRVTRFTIDEDRSRLFASQVRFNFFFEPNGEAFYYGVSDVTLRRRRLAEADESVVMREGYDGQPAISSDGTRLLLVRGRSASIVTLATGEVTTRQLPFQVGYYGTAWTATGALVASDATTGGFNVLPVDGGGPLRRLPAPQGWVFRWPIAVGNADRVLFTAYSAATDSMMLMSASAGELTARPTGAKGVVALGLVDDVLISADTDGQTFAMPFDARSGTVSGSAVSLGLRILMAPSGLLLPYATMSTRGDLAYVETGTGSTLEYMDTRGHRTLALPDTLVFEHPRWSPDASRIVVTVFDRPSRRRRVWLLDRKAGQFEPLLPDDAAESDRSSFMRSGTEVLYRRIAAGGARYFIYDLTGQRPQRPASPAGANMFDAEGAPDGITMFGRGTFGDNTPRLWIWDRRDTTGATMRSFADAAFDGLGPRISPDGRWAAFEYAEVGASKSQLWVTPFPGPGRRFPVGAADLGKPVWSPSGRALYNAVPDGLYAVELDLGERVVPTETRRLSDLPLLKDQIARAQFDVARDGTIVLSHQLRGRRFVIVRNFIAEVRAKMRAEAR